MVETRDIFNLGNPQTVPDLVRSLSFVLARISDRLDRMEGLRGNPRFYTTALEFPTGLTPGQVLQAASASAANFGPIDASEMITRGVLKHERGGLDADVSAFNGLVKISGGVTSQVPITSLAESLIAQATAALMRAVLGIPALGSMASQDAGNVAITGGAISGVVLSDLLVSILDENGTVIHQFPIDLIPYFSEVTNFLTAAPILSFPDSAYDLLDARYEKITALHSPFFDSTGASQPIALTAAQKLPFFLANASEQDIPLTT